MCDSPRPGTVGKIVKIIEDLSSASIEEIVMMWLDDSDGEKECEFHASINRFFDDYNINSLAQRSSIRKAFIRYIKRYHSDASINFQLKDPVQETCYSALAEYYDMPPMKALSHIVENRIPLREVTVEVWGSPDHRRYNWLYRQIERRFGREVVKSLCPNKPVYKRSKQEAPYYKAMSRPDTSFDSAPGNVGLVTFISVGTNFFPKIDN